MGLFGFLAPPHLVSSHGSEQESPPSLPPSPSHGAEGAEQAQAQETSLPPTPPPPPLPAFIILVSFRLSFLLLLLSSRFLFLPSFSLYNPLGRFEAAMKRANKVVLAQPAAAAPPLLPRAPCPAARGGTTGGGEASRARLRHRSLLQDYKDLLKETEAKKNRLHLEKMKKQRLLAEVKFLRKRYKSMSENPSQTVVYRVKNPAMAAAPTPRDERHRPTVHAVGSSSKGPPEHHQRRQHSALRASPVIDLNEACELSSEETEEFDGYQDSARVKSNYYTLEGDDDAAAGPSDAKMASAFWDVRNPAARAGKRKISWQDQLALRV